MKRIFLPSILMMLVIIIAGCGNSATRDSGVDAIKSYKDIPGITQEEITAIEALKEQRNRFSYGHLFETESFRLQDGTYAGFTIKFCDLLSEMFDKEFTAVHYYDWELLKGGIDDLSIDFSGDFSTTAEQMARYYMTTPIAGRTLNLYTLKDSDDIISESDINGKRLGFLAGTVTAGIIKESYPELSFETIEIAKTSVAADMLKSGEIDAFVMDEVMDLEFERYDYISSKRFFVLVHTSVSLTTANPELEPIISVVNKYLAAGGVNKLFELYNEGEYEYTKYKLNQSFTAEEKAYMKRLETEGLSVPVGIQYDIYPVSFYNEREKEFQGIAPEILNEVTALTGIEFEPADFSVGLSVSEIIDKLKNDEISLATQVVFSDTRKGSYIWSEVPYHSSHYALLSRYEFSDLAIHEVFYARVGTISKTVHEEMFNTWFPGHKNHTVYETTIEAFDALENGEIDLLMMSESLLLGQTNYREKPGFKVNISFEKTADSRFGYNTEETVLCSIIDKTMHYIDLDKISKQWLNKTFDYSKKFAQMQTIYVSIFALAVVIVLAGITLLFLKNKRLGKSLMVAVEEAQAASKVKSQFLANMSHEIRTPMNAVIGMSELLLSEPLTIQQKDYAKDINASSHSLLAIINDILDFSKIEAGKSELNPINYYFDVFIDNICSVFKHVVKQKGIEFKFETNGEMPKCLYGDDIRLGQVLTNIFGNAVKFTNEGFVRFGITSESGVLKFEIEDTGMGIREEEMPKIFSAFMQADELKNRSIKGTGLGLAISKSFVEMMGGRIYVSSVYGKGTVFTVEIPLVAGDEKAIINAQKKNKSFISPSAKVLVVDDNTLNLKVASGLLNMYKISAVTADSADKGIASVKENDYDIVFMDHMMPFKDGIEATHEIRALGGKYETLTIVALTANAVRGAREMFLSNGFNDFISKPIETHELTDILLRLLPDEKIEQIEGVDETDSEADASQSSEQSEFMQALGKVNGINTEIGISRFSGMEEMYRDTVELFNNKVLGERDKLQSYLESNDLHSFAVLVHGIKSSLSTIGAMELSETAFSLEKASKDSDLDYCNERFPAFSEQLRQLYEQLSEVIAVIADKQAEEPLPEGNAELLNECINATLDAVDLFEMDTALEALQKVLAYDYGEQTNSLLKKAKSAIDDFDFDTAGDLLKDIVAQ